MTVGQHLKTLKAVSKNLTNLVNEPILNYYEGTGERCTISRVLKQMLQEPEEVPIVIGDQEFTSTQIKYQVMPHNFEHKLAKFYHAEPDQIDAAIKNSICAQKGWAKVSVDDKIKIWNKAGNLMASKYRQQLNAATMLGQGKTIYQAEIDAACELIDFTRMNAAFLNDLMCNSQLLSPDPKITRNRMVYRPLDGFVAAISPFNFTAIGGNLAYTPALMGNSVLWKPSDNSILSNWIIFKIMREAGVPPGVVNFIPCDGPTFGKKISSSPNLGGVNFTGSLQTFQTIWKEVSNKLDNKICFPRLIGECGGKNFHFVHPSADVESVVSCTIRSAFEYSGQKCSACSRLIVPMSLWFPIKDGLVENVKKLKIGDVSDFSVFTSAVINEQSFKKLRNTIEYARRTHEIIYSGKYCNDVGYFVEPTIVKCDNPLNRLMQDEFFGPLLTVYVYLDSDLDEAIEKVTGSTKFALTGSIFATDKNFLLEASEKFKMLAGNLYINDKSTGAVVFQQPFGGGKLSGTNDKAGAPQYLLRWTSPQSIKQTFVPLTEITYPYMS